MTDQETRLVKATPQPDQPRTRPKKDKRRSQGDPLSLFIPCCLVIDDPFKQPSTRRKGSFCPSFSFFLLAFSLVCQKEKKKKSLTKKKD
ncbi:MAG: hypothetical protein GF308_03290 [Candidatus Heimdallarchaeota archaeon]|nr:hypothetical protein [Candidatus Heimdallarchaeota archaeon]